MKNKGEDKMKAELKQVKKMMELKNEGKFEEYLSRPVVSGYKAEITDKKVEVSADYTGFVYKYKRTIIDKEDFKEVLKQLRKLGKYNETKLKGINKVGRYIEDNYYDYLKEVVEYNAEFERLRNDWEGYEVHEGFSDDEFLHEYLLPLGWKLDKKLYRNTKLSRLEDKYSELKGYVRTLDSELSGESHYHTVSLTVG